VPRGDDDVVHRLPVPRARGEPSRPPRTAAALARRSDVPCAFHDRRGGLGRQDPVEVLGERRHDVPSARSARIRDGPGQIGYRVRGPRVPPWTPEGSRWNDPPGLGWIVQHRQSAWLGHLQRREAKSARSIAPRRSRGGPRSLAEAVGFDSLLPLYESRVDVPRNERAETLSRLFSFPPSEGEMQPIEEVPQPAVDDAQSLIVIAPRTIRVEPVAMQRRFRKTM
jgi:hypothetical protein